MSLKQGYVTSEGEPLERMTCDTCGCVIVEGGVVIDFGRSAGREPDWGLLEDSCPFYSMEDLTSCRGTLRVTEEDAALFDAQLMAMDEANEGAEELSRRTGIRANQIVRGRSDHRS